MDSEKNGRGFVWWYNWRSRRGMKGCGSLGDECEPKVGRGPVGV